MARIPASEIEGLKLEVSMVRLAEAAGIALKPHGHDVVGRCPFHDDKTPSLVISPKANLWHCLGACQAGGSVIDWVMRFENVSFRRAVELLGQDIGAVVSVDGVARVSSAAVAPAATPLLADTNDQALIARVLDHYHATLKQSAEAQAYLAKRGLTHPELIEHFRLGFADRTLAYQLPPMQVKAGAAIRTRLQKIGLLRDSGHEHFNGSLIVPVIDAGGDVTEIYGRKIGPRLREGTPLHLYLPGPHRGVFNEAGLVGQGEAILCEALIDALTFWCAGYRNVTASYGIEGFTDEHLEAFRKHGVQRVLIAYDSDAAGDAAADKLAPRLIAAGFDAYRCRFPKGMDANAYALAVTPAVKSLGVVIRQAEWLGGTGRSGVRDSTVAQLQAALHAAAAVDVSDASKACAAAACSDDAPFAEAFSLAAAVVGEASPAAAMSETAPSLREPALPESAPPAFAIAPNGELTLALGDRTWRVRGIEKNLAGDALKVLVRVGCGGFEHIDALEFYAAKQRSAWVRAASVELGVAEDVLRGDLIKLLRVVEERQDALIREQSAARGTAAALTLTAAEEDAALVFLKAPDLIERIVDDFARCGLVGEPTNALVGYLAAVSRKLKHPLAILIQSTSAAGKSTLMDAVLNFVPESDRIQYSAMTGQSLFYLGDKDIKHKILAIAEEEGVRQAAYSLKLLQSQGSLTMASTGKDPVTGKLETQDYTVEGPVMLFLTTTASDVDEELTNRCLVLTIDESREQTQAILQRQRQARTLAGLMADREGERITALHRHAQTLLRPLAMVNPFAEGLGFRDDLTRLRRDHQKYLTLIEAIAFLHQHQREIKRSGGGQDGEAIEYIEVTPTDIALANRLAHEVLGRSLDELTPQTRRVLTVIDTLVAMRVEAQAIERSLVRFTRRDVRAVAGTGDTQLGLHLDRLVRFEYLIAHAGKRGQSYVYELAFDGDTTTNALCLPGLIEVEALNDTTTTTEFSGSESKLSGSKRPQNGAITAPSRGSEIRRNASADASFPSLVAAPAETALLRSRSNGASHRSADSSR